MKYLAAALASTATLFISPAAAGFDIYKCQTGSIVTGEVTHSYSYFNGPPSCDEAGDATIYSKMKDVSGDKTGVRCSGGCANDDDAEDIDVLEMNLGDHKDRRVHWTLYKEYDYLLYGKNDETYGSCKVYGGHGTGKCQVTGAGYYECDRKFQCETDDDWNADDFND